jgi:hypothetical protein
MLTKTGFSTHQQIEALPMSFSSAKPPKLNDKAAARRRLLEAIEQAGSDATVEGIGMRDIADLLDSAASQWARALGLDGLDLLITQW